MPAISSATGCRSSAMAARCCSARSSIRTACAATSSSRPHAARFEAVVGRTAALVASWQLVGFIHGVMNPDNMSIAGETIDYGPCAFMDTYHPGTVYSSIDSGGRYAYGNQPRIAQWNLASLAEALLPLLGDDEAAAVAAAQAAIGGVPARLGA